MLNKLKSIFLGKSAPAPQTTVATQQPTLKATRYKGTATRQIQLQYRREISYQISDITQALQLVENPLYPDRRRLYDIYRYILRDGHLSSQIRVAMKKVLAEPWLLYKDGQPDLAASDLFHRRWFSQLIAYILESEFWGHSLVECDMIDPTTINIGEVQLIDRIYVSPEKQWILLIGQVNGQYLPYGDAKMEMELLEFGDPYNLGCLLECAYNVIWKYYGRSDWSRYNEKFGMPLLSIVVDTQDAAELDKVEAHAQAFGTDGYMIAQKGDEVNIIERQQQNGYFTYKDNIALCNDEISKIINGQTSTSDQKAYVGAAQVQDQTMDDFTKSRLQNIVDEMKENVIPYLLYKGFPLEGYTFDYPTLKRARENKINGPSLMMNDELGIRNEKEKETPTTNTPDKGIDEGNDSGSYN